MQDVVKTLAESDTDRWLFLEKDGKMMVAAEKKQKDGVPKESSTL